MQNPLSLHQETRFLLHELFEVGRLWPQMPATRDLDAELVEQILDEGGRLCDQLLAPLDRRGDEQGCRWVDGAVLTPAGFAEAWRSCAEAGWMGLGGEPEHGGQGLPKLVTVLFEERLFAANSSFALYAVLTSGAALTLASHGTAAQRERYLPALYAGRCSGAMCLTEPQAGSDLGLIRSRAEPDDNGQYLITGSKIFITGGEHDLSDDILHLVLARLPDAPAGSRGLSLFLVPKFLPAASGGTGPRNRIFCRGIEQKMGIRASATCTIDYEGAMGELVGAPHQGLAAMFTMMNYERLSIALQGLGLGEAAYQAALAHARERQQGRAATTSLQRNELPADPIVLHGDVRHSLLTQKALNEGGRAFACYVALQLDLARFHPDAQQREQAAALVALLTPVAKAFMTDQGFENCVRAQQLFGGLGYMTATGIEQRLRDARIAQIYEGTNGIQAMDLLERKVLRDGGAMLRHFCGEIDHCLAAERDNPPLAEFTQPLAAALARLRETSDWLIGAAPRDAELPGAVASDYLKLVGLTAYAFVWTLTARAALRQSTPFHQGKVATARFFFARLLPQSLGLAASIRNGAASPLPLF
jgi:alkylation response protein AidB-like acyl-CoA dehydrogenase